MKKREVLTIKVDVSKVPRFIEKGDYENYVNSIKVGNSIHRPKKGKGSYVRKPKHPKKAWDRDSVY